MRTSQVDGDFVIDKFMTNKKNILNQSYIEEDRNNLLDCCKDLQTPAGYLYIHYIPLTPLIPKNRGNSSLVYKLLYCSTKPKCNICLLVK